MKSIVTSTGSGLICTPIRGSIGIAVQLMLMTTVMAWGQVDMGLRIESTNEVRWITQTNGNYQLESSTNLLDWLPSGPKISLIGGDISQSILNTAASAFFRVSTWNVPEDSRFITVKGTEFYYQGKPFYFAGANAYHLWYAAINAASAAPNQGALLPLLDAAVALHLKVIRTWGSSEGTGKYGFCFQPDKGVYDEATFAHFDRVVKEAGDRNLKLIIALANNWSHFGGMSTYCVWAGLSNQDHDAFYTNETARSFYRQYVAYFLNRTNTLTGVQYKNDPTIMALELANESRCQSDKTGTTLNRWIQAMSRFIKSIDTNHLVTTGIDGFYVNKGLEPTPWWYNGNDGQDYLENHRWSTIDFATFHYYPEYIFANTAEWLGDHIQEAHQLIGKPVVIGEFNTQSDRLQLLTQWYQLLETQKVNGDCLWRLSDPSFAANNDWYQVVYPTDTNVCDLILSHARFMEGR